MHQGKRHLKGMFCSKNLVRLVDFYKMPNYQSILLILITLAILSRHGGEAQNEKIRACDAPSDTANVTQVSRYTYDKVNVLTIKSDIRSMIECLVQCKQNALCFRSFYEEQRSKCYLMRENAIGELSYFGPVEKHNYVMDLMILTYGTPLRECAAITCDADDFCTLDCTHSTATPEPICTTTSSNSCPEEPIANMKHYYLGAPSWSSSGTSSSAILLWSGTFTKLYSWSGLRISWRSSLRGGPCSDCCHRWYFTLNGAECSDPDTIEFVHYIQNNRDYRRSDGIDGICENIAYGNVAVQLYVDKCSGYSHDIYHITAEMQSRVYIEETDLRNNAGEPLCPGLSVFNVYQHVLRQENSGGVNTIYTSFSYKKRSADTALRLTWNGNVRVSGDGSNRCARWEFIINGSPCSSPNNIGAMTGNLGGSTNNPDDRKNSHYEGICENVAAGDLTIGIKIMECLCNTYSSSSILTGWMSASRVIVEEVRLSHAVAAVDYGNQLRRVPVFNLRHFQFHCDNDPTDSGTVMTASYTKVSEYSALRIVYSGDMRNYYREDSSYSPCCRWFFAINNAECTDPGAIEGLVYQNKNHNYHKPGLVDGICRGHGIGTYTIDFRTGPCPGEINGECYTGWNSLASIRVEETFMDEA